jgi:pimeloyl-ACP methyl ester carboxylesterase
MKRALKILQVILAIILLISCSRNNGNDLFTKSTDGVDICYSTYGNGKDILVFVHGWSCDKSYWCEQVGDLQDDYKIVTIDLGGHGGSGLGREDWTMSSFGEDVNSVLNQFNYRKAFLVGHSMGADVIIEAAANNLSNIELILVDRFKKNPRPWPEEYLKNFLIPFEEDFFSTTRELAKGPAFFIEESDSQLVEFVSNDMAQANASVALSAFRNLSQNDIKPTIISLKERGIKMTAINSDYQNINSDSLKELGINSVIMTNVGHFVMMENPDEFNKIIRELIK